MEDQLSAWDGQPEVLYEPSAGLELIVHLGCKEAEGAPSFSLRPVKGGIDIAQERFASLPIGGGKGNAYAHSYRNIVSLDPE